MINKIKKNKAMTLAEVMVMFFVIGVVATVTLGITSSKADYAKKYMYYSAYNNIKQAIGINMADGFNSPTTSTLERALPNRAHLQDPAHPTNWIGFCDVMVNTINTVGTTRCDYSTALNDASNFASATPSFTATNGVVYYNFGVDPTALVGNNILSQVYTVYVDIDGKNRGKSLLSEDIMKFTIDRAGNVFPWHTSIGANSLKYMSTSIKYNSPTGLNWLAKGLTYRQGACQSGLTTNATYCPAEAQYTKSSICCITPSCSAGTFPCDLVINKP